jgi:hypothetical protein
MDAAHKICDEYGVTLGWLYRSDRSTLPHKPTVDIACIKLPFRGSTIAADAGLLPYRELDDTPGLTDTDADTFADARSCKNGNLWARPALHLRKLRDLELKAGHKPARGQKGTAHAYNLKSLVRVEAGPGIPAVAVDCQSEK